VDRRELGRGLRQLGLYVAEDDVSALFRCLDADGNGAVDELCVLLDL
jgi:Ca2+-binding EF-hand superfamily protein